MRICILGAGYVGLVCAAGFAEMGNSVWCADVDRHRIAQLRGGPIPIYEPGLDDLVRSSVQSGRLGFSDDAEAVIREAEVVFVAVGTPAKPDGTVDLGAVDISTRSILAAVAREAVVVMKSTVPPGTGERLRRLLCSAPYPIHVVSNPEFLKEGDAVNDFMHPDRIVIGCHDHDQHARDVMRRLYHPLCLDRDRIVWMDPVSAELTKYVGNTLLAMRISFMNEISELCEQLGADIQAVRIGVGTDPRIGNKFLYAGPGYGGSCFPKDVKALLSTGREHGLELELVAATDRVNQRQKEVLFRKLKRHFNGSLKTSRIGVWGVAFKPRTDDIRESPALALIDALLEEGAEVTAHDPAQPAAIQARFEGRLRMVDDAYKAADGADALVLVTEWREYQNPDFERLRLSMRRPVLVDGRNIWASYGLRKQGFIYEGIGVRGS